MQPSWHGLKGHVDQRRLRRPLLLPAGTPDLTRISGVTGSLAVDGAEGRAWPADVGSAGQDTVLVGHGGRIPEGQMRLCAGRLAPTKKNTGGLARFSFRV